MLDETKKPTEKLNVTKWETRWDLAEQDFSTPKLEFSIAAPSETVNELT